MRITIQFFALCARRRALIREINAFASATGSGTDLKLSVIAEAATDVTIIALLRLN